MKFPKIFATVFLSCIGLMVALPAQAVLTIDSATWDGKKLVVEGGDGRGGEVNVYYGYDTPPNSNLLGTATVKGSGSWKLQITSNRRNPLDPVPCAVSATLASEVVLDFPVAGADPNTCAPQPPVQQVCNIAVAPTTLAFGDVTEGTTATLTTTVSNSGAAACDVTLTQPANTDFAAAPPLAFTVAPASSQVVSVNYTPSAVGPDTGTLAVGSNDPDTPNVDVALSGTGIPVQVDECDITVSPIALNFGDVQIGTTSSLTTTVGNIGAADCTVTITQTGSTDFTAAPLSFTVLPSGSQVVSVDYSPATVGADTGNLAVGSNDPDTPNVDVSLSGNGIDQQANNAPTARGDTYATPVGKTLTVTASRLSGVLYNDFDVDGDPITITGNTTTANGTLAFNAADGSFTYTPNGTLGDNDNDSFTYTISDGTDTATATVNIAILSDQPDYKIMMNYELGMHCTGFEFSYCCVLPPYNSILAQVVKPESNGGDFPRLLEGDPNVGLDGLGRETVVRDFDENNNTISKYQLRYSHDAQPRNEGQGRPILGDSLISAVEGNSLQYFNSIYDSAAVDPVTGALVTGTYNGTTGIVLGDGDLLDPTDNFANGWLNHFYIFLNADGNPNLEGENASGGSLEIDKIRLGVTGHVEYPANSGAALQPMGPTGTVPAGFENVLTFSADTGTVVYTQMKVLENLPIMLTSPKIWEALGLPLTPFEDTIAFFGSSPDGPGSVDEDSIRPYVAMKAQMYEANCDATGACTVGNAVMGSNGHPVIGFGTAPIDIPNCERCHSVTDPGAANSPSNIRTDFIRNNETLAAITDAEYAFWYAYYNLLPGDSDWYARLKSAAINMLALHDFDQGTGFTSNWPANNDTNPATNPNAQNTRLGKESVICQKCHADNVIAAVKSATRGGSVIKPITEAIHWRHREVSEGGTIDFADAAGRSGGCQGCHPAHRSDGVMDGYPITLGGDNEQANSDNRLAAGGCFVGRDVHSNPMKDVDGVETPAHLNAVGQWLSDNVFYNQDGVAGVAGHDTRGLWCTNCHTQLGQEMWKTENCPDLINGDCITDPRGEPTLASVAAAVGVSEEQAIAWLDPTADNPLGDFTHAIWEADPGLCDFLVNGGPAHDAKLATIEVSIPGGTCSTGEFLGPIDCGPVNGGPAFEICGSYDADPGGAHPAGDFSVNILDFCTTGDCVDTAQVALNELPTAGSAVAVPFSAATDGRDHWLSPGEPHCADCHTAPYVEPSGANIGEKDFKPPFNYPRKASLMRYSTGHQGVTCQGCHESIHGLYPVTPTIDSTSYAQAAALNPDGSHGPLKCGTCHTVDADGLPTWIRKGRVFGSNLDDATTWAHTYTDNADPLVDTCQNCHGDRSSKIREDSGKWLRHAFVGRIGRLTQDKAEINSIGWVAGDPDHAAGSTPQEKADDIANRVCSSCHSLQGGPSGAFLAQTTCDNVTWKQHLTQGRIAEKVWEFITVADVDNNQDTTSCGW